MTPPTPTSPTISPIRSRLADPSGAKSPNIHGMMSWPAFSSRVKVERTESAQESKSGSWGRVSTGTVGGS